MTSPEVDVKQLVIQLPRVTFRRLCIHRSAEVLYFHSV